MRALSSFFYKGLFLALLALSAQLSGCGSGDSSQQTSTIMPQPSETHQINLATYIPQDVISTEYVSYTYQQPIGNRLAEGSGELPNVDPIDIQLDSAPQWLVATPYESGSIWVSGLVDGKLQAFFVSERVVEPIAVDPSDFIESPLALGIFDGRPHLIAVTTPDISQHTHPVVVPPTGNTFAFVSSKGDLVLWESGEIARLPINALLDCRPLVDNNGRLLVLTDPSDRYSHGILGDTIEATSITIIETIAHPQIKSKLEITSPQVIEGLSPIWADLDSDGDDEIIVTVSDAQNGAKILAYDENADLIAAGPAIGTGYRWRHQLVVAPFGPEAEIELAVIRTPHIGGVVEFYRLEGESLEITSTISGYSSHKIGSRNLDTAVAGDFDSDNRIELLVPNQAFDELAALQRTEGGVKVDWTLPLHDEISTNLASVPLSSGKMALGVGLKGNTLRLWIS